MEYTVTLKAVDDMEIPNKKPIVVIIDDKKNINEWITALLGGGGVDFAETGKMFLNNNGKKTIPIIGNRVQEALYEIILKDNSPPESRSLNVFLTNSQWNMFSETIIDVCVQLKYRLDIQVFGYEGKSARFEVSQGDVFDGTRDILTGVDDNHHPVVQRVNELSSRNAYDLLGHSPTGKVAIVQFRYNNARTAFHTKIGNSFREIVDGIICAHSFLKGKIDKFASYMIGCGRTHSWDDMAAEITLSVLANGLDCVIYHKTPAPVYAQWL